jgi:hypothetical protein
VKTSAFFWKFLVGQGFGFSKGLIGKKHGSLQNQLGYKIWE